MYTYVPYKDRHACFLTESMFLLLKGHFSVNLKEQRHFTENSNF